MRAIQKGGAATIVVWVLGGAACDASSDTVSVEHVDEGTALSIHDEAVIRDEAVVTTPTPERTKALGPAFDHRGRPISAQPHVRPMNGARLDNLTCETAVRISDAGVVNVPVTTHNGRAGCESQQYQQRYFKVSAQPNEVVWVTVEGPAGPDDFSNLWVSADAACTFLPNECTINSAWQYRSVGFENTTKAPIEHFVAVTTSDWSTQPSFSLKVDRAKRAANAECGKALPLTDGMRVEGQRGAVVWGSQSSLFYYVDVPARSRIEVNSLGGAAYFREACGEDALSQSFSGGPSYANLDEATKRVLVEIQRYWWDEPSFDVGIALTQIVPEASCTSPRSLAVGDAVEVNPGSGAQGPAQCWCLSPERAIYVDVEVPANSSVSVLGTVSEENTGAQLIELPSACSDSCGDNASFGWSDRPAELVFDNDGAEATVRRVLVTSDAVWQEDGTTKFFPVTVSVTLNKE